MDDEIVANLEQILKLAFFDTPYFLFKLINACYDKEIWDLAYLDHYVKKTWLIWTSHDAE